MDRYSEYGSKIGTKVGFPLRNFDISKYVLGKSDE